MAQTTQINCPDGTRLACTLVAPEGLGQVPNLPPRYVIINSATAVRRAFYAAFAQYLAHAGFHVLLWDGRGIGDSRRGHAKQDTARMRDWGALDLEAVLQHARTLAGDWAYISVIGHSSGGHLSGLAPSLQHVQHLALVASGTCDWRLYPKGQWLRLLAVWYGLAPALLAMLGYLPGKLGLGHDLPPGVAWDWRNWSARRGYLFADFSLDLTGYSAFKGKLLALHFTDDTGFAPPQTVTDLLRHFDNASVERITFNPREQQHKPVGHFGFFSEKNADLWPLVRHWLDG
jgi:predicted alpha/beta hydrolase